MKAFRTMVRRLVFLLDRPGTRWIIAGLLPLIGRLLPNGVRQLQFESGWVHRFDDDIALVEPTPRLRSYHLDEEHNRLLWGLLYEPSAGDTIVDLGAGLGSEAIYFGRRVGPFGRVISLEAHPTIARYLERSIALNRLYHVTVLNLALADRKGTAFIEDDMALHQGNSIRSEGEGIPVKAVSLDELCDELGVKRIDLLRMNIEGAERLALAGMDVAIERTAVVAISCHDFKAERTGDEFFRTKAIVERYLRDRGFVIVSRTSDNSALADQVNAYNPKLVDPSSLRTPPAAAASTTHPEPAVVAAG